MTPLTKKLKRIVKLIVILIIMGKSDLKERLDAVKLAIYDNNTNVEDLTPEAAGLTDEVDALYISLDANDDPDLLDEYTVDPETDITSHETAINSVYEIWRGTLD